MTKNRTAILAILTAEAQPLNASQLKERVDQDLATIYRGLSYLEENKYISSFVFDCSERGIERYYNVRKIKHDHYMHCEGCHSFTALPSCPIEKTLMEIGKEQGFIVDEHFLTMKGLCRNCAGKQKKDQ